MVFLASAAEGKVSLQSGRRGTILKGRYSFGSESESESVSSGIDGLGDGKDVKRDGDFVCEDEFDLIDIEGDFGSGIGDVAILEFPNSPNPESRLFDVEPHVLPWISLFLFTGTLSKTYSISVQEVCPAGPGKVGSQANNTWIVAVVGSRQN